VLVLAQRPGEVSVFPATQVGATARQHFTRGFLIAALPLQQRPANLEAITGQLLPQATRFNDLLRLKLRLARPHHFLDRALHLYCGELFLLLHTLRLLPGLRLGGLGSFPLSFGSGGGPHGRPPPPHRPPPAPPASTAATTASATSGFSPGLSPNAKRLIKGLPVKRALRSETSRAEDNSAIGEIEGIGADYSRSARGVGIDSAVGLEYLSHDRQAGRSSAGKGLSPAHGDRDPLPTRTPLRTDSTLSVCSSGH